MDEPTDLLMSQVRAKSLASLKTSGGWEDDGAASPWEESLRRGQAFLDSISGLHDPNGWENVGDYEAAFGMHAFDRPAIPPAVSVDPTWATDATVQKPGPDFVVGRAVPLTSAVPEHVYRGQDTTTAVNIWPGAQQVKVYSTPPFQVQPPPAQPMLHFVYILKNKRALSQPYASLADALVSLGQFEPSCNFVDNYAVDDKGNEYRFINWHGALAVDQPPKFMELADAK